MSNVDQLKKLKEGLVLLSRDREVVFSFHETFKHVDELLEIVDDLLAKESLRSNKSKSIILKVFKLKTH